MIDAKLHEGGAGNVRTGQHVVHFYRHAEQMVLAACRYIAEGLRRGEAVLIVATRMHWARMVGLLAARRGVDIVDAVMNGQLRHLDTETVLAGLLENGMPDDRRFHEHAGGLVERASRRFGHVRVFTELPGILWESGNRQASVHLEALWNTLRTRLPFALLCSYRLDGEDPSLRQVCGAHSHLLPMG